MRISENMEGFFSSKGVEKETRISFSIGSLELSIWNTFPKTSSKDNIIQMHIYVAQLKNFRNVELKYNFNIHSHV